MPIFDDTIANDIAFEENLLQLADQYGPETFQRMLQRLSPQNNAEAIKMKESVLLDDAVLHYYESDAFQSLAQTSQQAYRCEMNLFIRYCERLKGANPNIKEISSTAFLNEYLAPVQSLNTRNKKMHF